MKLALVPLALFGILLTIPSQSDAGNCGISSYSTCGYSYAAPVYAPPVALVPVLSAVFVPAATYTVGVTAPAVQTLTTQQTVTQQAATQVQTQAGVLTIDQKFDTIMGLLQSQDSKLKSFESRILALEKNGNGKFPVEPAPAPKQNPKDPPPLSATEKADVEKAVVLFKNNCAQCHSAGIADDKSAGFSMFDKAGQFHLSKDGADDARTAEMMALSLQRKISKERKCPGATVALTGQDKTDALKVLPQ